MAGLVTVALDAMGGDHAPQATVQGAVLALRDDPDLAVLLVGDEARLRSELGRHGHAERLEVVHASEVVAMDEAPARAVRARPDNSMSVGMRLVRAGRAAAFATAGNTGAALASALFELGRIRGIRRPALATVMPAADGFFLILDIGANADCRAADLVQFGLMGRVYAERVLGIAEPRVALISNGEEQGKGNELVKEATAAFLRSNLRFVGNVEGKDLPLRLADVVVTDGFTGNVLIKTAEGVAYLIVELLRRELRGSWRGRVGALLARPALRRVFRQLDYAEFGGAPLLGVDGVVVVGHGRSDARAIAGMLRAAKRAAQQDLVVQIAEGLVELEKQLGSNA